jgi:hypothetical protein
MMPVLLGLVYRKTPWWSGIAACSAAFTLSIGLFVLDVWPQHAYPRNVFSAVFASTVVFVISAFWYRADDPKSAKAIQLDRDLRTPVEDTPMPVGGGLGDYAMLAWVSAILGAVLLLCWFLPARPPAYASVNVAAGLLLFLIAGLLWRVSRPKAGV